MPPYTARIRSPVWAPRRRASASICTTSSRVGAMMSTRGAVGPLRAGAGLRRQRVKAAMRKAAVLPVPVCDCPATSLPLRARGSVPSWMGVMITKPASWMPRTTGPGRSREAKSTELMWPMPWAWGEAGADDAHLVEDAQRPCHEGLVDHVGSGSEDGRDDEVDEDGVLAVPR